MPSEGVAVEDSEKPDSSVPDATSFNFVAVAVQGSTVSPLSRIAAEAVTLAIASPTSPRQVGSGVFASPFMGVHAMGPAARLVVDAGTVRLPCARRRGRPSSMASPPCSTTSTGVIEAFRIGSENPWVRRTGGVPFPLQFQKTPALQG